MYRAAPTRSLAFPKRGRMPRTTRSKLPGPTPVSRTAAAAAHARPSLGVHPQYSCLVLTQQTSHSSCHLPQAHSIILADAAPGGLPAEALFLAYRGTDGKSQEPEIYPRPNGEVYVCGASTPTPLPSFADQVLPDAGAPARLHEAAAAASRHLAQAEVLREQACYLPCSPVGTPAIGPVRGVRGLYVAAGHSCWGILNAPATGLALAELIVDGEASCVSLRAFEPTRAG